MEQYSVDRFLDGALTGTDEQSKVVQTVRGSLDADGTMMYDVALTAAASALDDGTVVTLKDVQLVTMTSAVPYSRATAGRSAVDWDWRWWVGDWTEQE